MLVFLLCCPFSLALAGHPCLLILSPTITKASKSVLFNECFSGVEDDTGDEVCDESEACLDPEDYEGEDDGPVVPEAEPRDDWDVDHSSNQIVVSYGYVGVMWIRRRGGGERVCW